MSLFVAHVPRAPASSGQPHAPLPAQDLKVSLDGPLGDAVADGRDHICERQGAPPSRRMLLQDGGEPVAGIAKQISPDKWDELARTYLLSD